MKVAECQNCNRVFRASKGRFCSPQCNAKYEQKQRERLDGYEKLVSAPRRYIASNGYVWVSPVNGRRLEHQVVMERMLGRPLRKGESVHHKNGIRHDNREQNLELWLDGIRRGQRASDIVCPHCGKPYLDEEAP